MCVAFKEKNHGKKWLTLATHKLVAQQGTFSLDWFVTKKKVRLMDPSISGVNGAKSFLKSNLNITFSSKSLLQQYFKLFFFSHEIVI